MTISRLLVQAIQHALKRSFGVVFPSTLLPGLGNVGGPFLTSICKRTRDDDRTMLKCALARTGTICAPELSGLDGSVTLPCEYPTVRPGLKLWICLLGRECVPCWLSENLTVLKLIPFCQKDPLRRALSRPSPSSMPDTLSQAWARCRGGGLIASSFWACETSATQLDHR